MKIDIDTLIYIIVMIVFIVLGAVGKKKKPVQKPAPVVDEDDEQEFSDPEDLITEKLKAFIGDYSQKDVSSGNIDNEKVADQPKAEEGFISVEDNYQTVEDLSNLHSDNENSLDKVNAIHDGIQEGDHVFSDYSYDQHSELVSGDLTKSDNQPDTDSYQLSLLNEVYEDFDVRKGIIFSEILNRRQI